MANETCFTIGAEDPRARVILALRRHPEKPKLKQRRGFPHRLNYLPVNGKRFRRGDVAKWRTNVFIFNWRQFLTPETFWSGITTPNAQHLWISNLKQELVETQRLSRNISGADTFCHVRSQKGSNLCRWCWKMARSREWPTDYAFM